MKYTYETIPIPNSNRLSIDIGNLFNTKVLYLDVLRTMDLYTLDDLLKAHYSIKLRSGRPIGPLDDIPAKTLNPLFKQLFLRLGIKDDKPLTFTLRKIKVKLGLVNDEPEKDYRRLIDFIGVTSPDQLDVCITELTTRNRHHLNLKKMKVYTYGDYLLLIHKYPTTFRVPSGMSLATFNDYLGTIYKECGVKM